MRLGISSAAFYGRMETDDAAIHVSRLPLDTCEVFLETASEYTLPFADGLRRALGAFPVASVHPMGTQFESQLFGKSSRQVSDAFRVFESVCAAGEALGASYYVFHGPFSVHGHLPPSRIYCLEERLAQLRSIAMRHHLTILWETVSWCSIASPADAEALLQRIPDAEFVLDIKQMHQANIDPFDMLSIIGHRVRHLHLLDWTEAGQLVLPGQGIFDFPRLAQALDDIGYDGALILEPYARQTEDEQSLLESIAYLRRVFF